MSIIAERKENGPYKSLENFCKRITSFQVNKRMIESLAKAGALDSLYPEQDAKSVRADILANIDRVTEEVRLAEEEAQQGFASLFGEEAPLSTPIKAAPFTQQELLFNEKEVLGLFFSGHPLAAYEQYLPMLKCTPIKDILAGTATGKLQVLGIVTLFNKKQNKKKQEWVKMMVEDCTGAMTINCFASAYEELGPMLAPNAMLCFSGEVKTDDESARVELNLQGVDDIAHTIGAYAKNLTIRIPPDYSTDSLKKLKAYLDAAVGETQVFLEITSKEDPTKIHKVRLNKRIVIHRPLIAYIEDSLGQEAWHIC